MKNILSIVSLLIMSAFIFASPSMALDLPSGHICNSGNAPAGYNHAGGYCPKLRSWTSLSSTGSGGGAAAPINLMPPVDVDPIDPVDPVDPTDPTDPDNGDNGHHGNGGGWNNGGGHGNGGGNNGGSGRGRNR